MVQCVLLSPLRKPAYWPRGKHERSYTDRWEGRYEGMRVIVTEGGKTLVVVTKGDGGSEGMRSRMEV